MKDTISGEWFVSRTKYGPFVHAKLGIGEENSGKLVTEVRKKAKEIGEKKKADFIIIDGPPGIGCPVIASLSGSDLALVVTEPTLSGIHDLERAIQTASHFGLKTACCINKYNINPHNSDQIEDWCIKNSIPVVGKIPFSHLVTESITHGTPLIEYSNNAVTRKIEKMWGKIEILLI